jgi:hypothetical protein
MIYPKVHVFAGTVVPVVSLFNHMVRWLIGHTPSLSKGATRTYQMAGCNDTSNPLELKFGASPGNHKNPSQDNHRNRPQTITNTCRTSSELLQAV